LPGEIGVTATSPSSTTTIPPKLITKTPPQQYDKSFINWCRYIALPTVKKWIFHGVDQDIVQLQQRDSRHSRTKRLEKMHSRAAHYDNQTEHLYSFLQVLTASTQSFAHG